jgi:heptosyltransferase-2
MAPGAAYGRAKQWLPERFTELATLLAGERDLRAVLVGASADAAVCRQIAACAPGAIDLCGKTDLPSLAGVLSRAHAVVANDSGAMHLAAATGAHVVAVFGATNEKRTAPLRASAAAPAATVVKSDVWCRPCMLRECPIDHRCMTSISARAVLDQI